MSTPPHLAVLCVKDHEFKELNKLLQANELAGYEVTHLDTITSIEDKYLKEKWALKNGGTERLRLTVCSFGHLQGPVEASGRTVAIITSENPRPDYISMVGIAGGRRLGDVTMAVSAAAPEDGHVEAGEPTAEFKRAADGYVYVSTDRGRWKSEAKWRADQDTPGANALMKNYVKDFNKDARYDFEVHQGEFFSYSQVRNDVELELARLREALRIAPNKANKVYDVIDMEAYAVLYMAQQYNVKIAPIFKGISDVGVEIMDENREGLTAFEKKLAKHNAEQMAMHAPAAGEDEDDEDDDDHTERRRLYRKHAGQNAAKAFLAFVEAALKQEGSWFSTATSTTTSTTEGPSSGGGAAPGEVRDITQSAVAKGNATVHGGMNNLNL